MQVNIKPILEQKQLSLQALSKLSNIDYSILHKLANNKTKSISFINMEKIANALNTSLDNIFIVEKKN